MDKGKDVKVYNRSGRPDNVVRKEQDIIRQCREIEKELPSFLKGYFTYLRSNVLPMTRLAYLHDIRFFCQYLIDETSLTEAECVRDITLNDFSQITAPDVNSFLDYCRHYEVEKDGFTVAFENSNKTLARKKSSLSVLFKQLYRDQKLEKNITDGFDPIRVPGASEREIKALQDDEVMIMLDAVSTGSHLTKKERQYWEKTKKRDKAILLLFLTYGLRLSELQQLNVSSFQFSRGRIPHLP